MNSLLKVVAVAIFSLISINAVAHDQAIDDNTAFEQEVEIINNYTFSNPAGSQWISVRCPKNTTCYPPAGYKFRHFNTDKRGSDCSGKYVRRVKETKDYIKTSRECSVIGRVFVWPAEACTGNARFCN